MAGIVDNLPNLKRFDDQDTTSEYTDNMIDELFTMESGKRPGVIIKDFNNLASVGQGQWNGPRAERLVDRVLKETRKADPAIAMQQIFEQDKMDSDFILKNKDEVSKLLSSDIGVATQGKQMAEDYAGYTQTAAKWGVKGRSATTIMADLIHRYGYGGAQQFLTKDGETTLDGLMTNLSDYEERANKVGGTMLTHAKLNARRVGKYAKAMGGEAGALMDFVDLAKEAIAIKTDPNYSFETKLEDSVSPEMKESLAEAVGVKIPDYFKETEPVEEYESPYLASIQSFTQSLKEMFMPRQEEGKPFNFGALAQVLIELFEG